MRAIVTRVTLFIVEPQRAPLAEWTTWLSADEQQRAQKFKFANDRAAYLAAHGLLRAALSRVHPEVAPAGWVFSLGVHGKPQLADRDGPHFNLSHSQELVAVAISGVPVGVDVELVDARHATDDVARRVYGPSELADLAMHSSPVDRFFTRWVLKEAWVKATGVGIDDDLPAFELVISEGSASNRAQPRWKFAWWSPRPTIKLAVCVDSEVPLEVTPEEWS